MWSRKKRPQPYSNLSDKQQLGQFHPQSNIMQSQFSIKKKETKVLNRLVFTSQQSLQSAITSASNFDNFSLSLHKFIKN